MLAVVPHMTSPVVVAAGPGVASVAAELVDGPVIALPSDVDSVVGPTVGPWHYAPSGPALRARSLAIADAVARHGCTTAVVDVSAEVTALSRLLGLRVVAVRQSGRRGDAAHRLAYASADVVWVPQHRDLEPTGDEAVDDRWQFTGAFSRCRSRCSAPRRAPDHLRTVVLLVGRGGHSLDVGAWSRAAAPAGWNVVVVGTDRTDRTDRTDASDRTGRGATPSGPQPGAVEFRGQVDDIESLLGSADVVVTSAGWASVADVVACRSRLVVVAEDRPFDEQAVRAERLERLQLAVRLDHWPLPAELSSVLDRALSIRPEAWAAYDDGLGAQRAAALIDRCHTS